MKKLFQKGGPGGPGRGNRKQKPLERLTDEIEALLRRDLKAKDYKIRHSAANIALKLQKQVKETDDGPIIDPLIWELLNARFADMIDDGEVVEIEDEPRSNDEDSNSED